MTTDSVAAENEMIRIRKTHLTAWSRDLRVRGPAHDLEDK